MPSTINGQIERITFHDEANGFSILKVKVRGQKGLVRAKRIVKCFREKTLDIIEKTCDRLTEIDDTGEKRIQMIWKAWNDQKAIREVMVFLQ